jgi:hypothetical protein
LDPFALAAIENTTPAKQKRTTSLTQPIPVPTQVHNYEKMQESRERAKTLVGPLNSSPAGSPSDGTKLDFLFIYVLFIRSTYIG